PRPDGVPGPVPAGASATEPARAHPTPGSPARHLVALHEVADLAHQLLEDVLEEHDAGHRAVGARGVRHQREVRAVGLHAAEHGLHLVRGLRHRHRAHPPRRHRRGAPLGGGGGEHGLGRPVAHRPFSSTTGKRENPVRAPACSTSSGVAPIGTVVSSSRPTMTSPAEASENSIAPVISPTSSSRTPSARERSTIEATSSAVNAAATSSLGSTPIMRSTMLAIQLSSRMTGEATRLIHTSGGPNHRAARSGVDTARFFGTISPSTT